MSCCPSARPTAPMTSRHRMRVRYLGGRPVEIIGPSTGTRYNFSGMAREQLVDPRDAAAIVRSKTFRTMGVVDISDDVEE